MVDAKETTPNEWSNTVDEQGQTSTVESQSAATVSRESRSLADLLLRTSVVYDSRAAPATVGGFRPIHSRGMRPVGHG